MQKERKKNKLIKTNMFDHLNCIDQIIENAYWSWLVLWDGVMEENALIHWLQCISTWV